MVEVTDNQFEKIVSEAIDAIPPQYRDNMKNVGFVIEDNPTPEQREKLHLVNGMTLYGLYEGIPLTRRTGNYSGVLPDKITIFNEPIKNQAISIEELKEIVKNTIWHEVAHHFGLNHGQIQKLES